jgi:hypothetical protein
VSPPSSAEPPSIVMRFESWTIQMSFWVYAGMTSLLAAIATYGLIAPLCRWWRRSLHGCCRKCGYELTGNLSGVCPECGTAVKAPAGAKDSQPARGLTGRLRRRRAYG